MVPPRFCWMGKPGFLHCKGKREAGQGPDIPVFTADEEVLCNLTGYHLTRDDMYRRMRRLICFDMDSTLIQTECIDELAERAGVGAEVKAITESAMRGEIDFKESFTRRVALLKGLDSSVFEDIADKRN